MNAPRNFAADLFLVEVFQGKWKDWWGCQGDQAEALTVRMSRVCSANYTNRTDSSEPGLMIDHFMTNFTSAAIVFEIWGACFQCHVQVKRPVGL
ncbi:Uncharacterized protein HZ326_29148 [Fusarium oxysporum f. sp. albedinis]|nr:Uncharacterized protein HZ326_29148 [Fusarium oxysporum f. sp. albedinis]